MEQFAALSGFNVRTFFTETHPWPIKHISGYKHVFGRANSYLSIRKLFSSSKLHMKELLQLLGQIHTVKVNNIRNCSVIEIFLPTQCTHGPGEDPFEAVM